MSVLRNMCEPSFLCVVWWQLGDKISEAVAEMQRQTHEIWLQHICAASWTPGFISDPFPMPCAHAQAEQVLLDNVCCLFSSLPAWQPSPRKHCALMRESSVLKALVWQFVSAMRHHLRIDILLLSGDKLKENVFVSCRTTRCCQNSWGEICRTHPCKIQEHYRESWPNIWVSFLRRCS